MVTRSRDAQVRALPEVDPIARLAALLDRASVAPMRAPAAGPSTDTGCIGLVAGNTSGAGIACLGLGGTMAAFSSVNHVSLSVTDLDRSERFYTDVFDMVRMMDVGYARILLHPQTGFILGIATHEGAEREPFTELKTGLDHLGFAAASRAELVEWEQKLDTLSVDYTPIRDMEFGYHLNFRDPDNIALEIMAYNGVAACFLGEVSQGDIPQQEVEARLSEYLASLASDIGSG